MRKTPITGVTHPPAAQRTDATGSASRSPTGGLPADPSTAFILPTGPSTPWAREARYCPVNRRPEVTAQ